MIPNGHFHKEWTEHVRTAFQQPMKKFARSLKRRKKIFEVAPRPVNQLRPIVHGQTVRYQTKERLGRGFSLPELSEVKLNKRKCRKMGIAVDHRRRENNFEMLKTNINRLRDYLCRLIFYPMNNGKQTPTKTVQKIAAKPPKVTKIVFRTPSEDERAFSPFLLRRNMREINKKKKKRVVRNKNDTI